MRYEERVREIAEEMAWDCHSDHNPDSYGKLCDQLLPAARIAVKYMAEAVKSALFQSEDEGYWNGNKVNKYLKEEGLTPDNEHEKDKPCPHELRCHTRTPIPERCECRDMGLLLQQEVLTGQCPECGSDYNIGDTFCQWCKECEPTIRHIRETKEGIRKDGSKCKCGWCAHCQGLEEGDIVERDGQEYEICDIDEDGEAITIESDEGRPQMAYIMADDCKLIRKGAK